jgi:hypothetical protein
LFLCVPLFQRIKALSRTTTFQQPLSYISNKFPFLNESHSPKEVYVRTVPLILFTALLLFLAGCGSVSSNMGPTPTPMPTPMPSPSPVPSPSPTPASPDTFLASWLNNVGRSAGPLGTITVDAAANNGAGFTQVNGLPGGGNSNFVLQFCPYPQNFSNCVNVMAFATDSTNTANLNFTFPMKGTFSGAFIILDTTGFPDQVSGTGTTGVNFKSALLPAATITGGIGQTTGNSPGLGSVIVTNSTAHIMLTGALPNHTFNTAMCFVSTQSPCMTLGNVTTNLQGNASADVGSVPLAAGTIFRVSDANGVQFVTAFRVQ